MARFEFNEKGIEALKARATEQLQGQANVAIQQTVREVNAEIAGQPTDVVYAELVARLTAIFTSGFEPYPALRDVAQSISDRTLTDNG